MEQAGNTPTLLAAFGGHVACIDALARHGADLDTAHTVSDASMMPQRGSLFSEMVAWAEQLRLHADVRCCPSGSCGLHSSAGTAWCGRGQGGCGE